MGGAAELIPFMSVFALVPTPLHNLKSNSCRRGISGKNNWWRLTEKTFVSLIRRYVLKIVFILQVLICCSVWTLSLFGIFQYVFVRGKRWLDRQWECFSNSSRHIRSPLKWADHQTKCDFYPGFQFIFIIHSLHLKAWLDVKLTDCFDIFSSGDVGWKSGQRPDDVEMAKGITSFLWRFEVRSFKRIADNIIFDNLSLQIWFKG